jgi:hypothetical protein
VQPRAPGKRRFSDFELFLAAMTGFFIAPTLVIGLVILMSRHSWGWATLWAVTTTAGAAIMMNLGRRQHVAVATSIFLLLLAATLMLMLSNLSAF